MARQYKYYSASNSLALLKLKEMTGSIRHAQVLDQFAFWSINSIFILPGENSPSGWFCIPYDKIAEKTFYSLRSINQIVKKFEKLGLIEKKVKKIKNETRSCIRLTIQVKDALLNVSTTTQIKPATETKKCSFSSQNCTSKNAQIAASYIKKEKKEKSNNIINFSQSEKIDKLFNLPASVEKIFSKIGSTLTENQKAKLWGATINLEKQHKVKISNPTEFISWSIFMLTNTEFQLQHAKTFQHRLNSIMCLARSSKGLSLPIGFNNHWQFNEKTNPKPRQLTPPQKSNKATQKAPSPAVSRTKSFSSKSSTVSPKKSQHRPSSKRVIKESIKKMLSFVQT